MNTGVALPGALTWIRILPNSAVALSQVPLAKCSSTVSVAIA